MAPLTEPTITMDSFSTRLITLCDVRGLTYEDLALRSGINATQIGHYAAGERLPSVNNLHRLACALDISADVLLGIESASLRTVQAPPRMVRLFEQAAQLSSAQMDLLLGIAALMVEQRKRKEPS